MRSWIVIATCAGSMISGCFARGNARSASKQAADAAAAVACTRAHWGEAWEKLVADCWRENAQAAADAVADIELLFQERAMPAGARAAASSSGYRQIDVVAAAIAKKSDH